MLRALRPVKGLFAEVPSLSRATLPPPEIELIQLMIETALNLKYVSL